MAKRETETGQLQAMLEDARKDAALQRDLANEVITIARRAIEEMRMLREKYISELQHANSLKRYQFKVMIALDRVRGMGYTYYGDVVLHPTAWFALREAIMRKEE